jgi:hypothetical protein
MGSLERQGFRKIPPFVRQNKDAVPDKLPDTGRGSFHPRSWFRCGVDIDRYNFVYYAGHNKPHSGFAGARENERLITRGCRWVTTKPTSPTLVAN